jgi:hypothetical protein
MSGDHNEYQKTKSYLNDDFECPRCGHCCQALETDREWVGLTADEIWKCNKAKSGSAVEFHICYAHQNVEDFAEAIEAKLREKNKW